MILSTLGKSLRLCRSHHCPAPLRISSKILRCASFFIFPGARPLSPVNPSHDNPDGDTNPPKSLARDCLPTGRKIVRQQALLTTTAAEVAAEEATLRARQAATAAKTAELQTLQRYIIATQAQLLHLQGTATNLRRQNRHADNRVGQGINPNARFNRSSLSSNLSLHKDLSLRSHHCCNSANHDLWSSDHGDNSGS